MKTNQNRSLVCLLLAASVMGVAGCGTTAITSVPAVSGDTADSLVSKDDGVYYSLPKTYIKFSLKFDLWVEDPVPKEAEKDEKPKGGDKATAKKGDQPKTRYGVLLLSEKDGISVSEVLRKDPGQNYLLLSNDSGWADITDYKVALTPEGYLSAVNATYENKAAEIGGNFVATVIDIAKLVVKGTVGATDHPLRGFTKTERQFSYSFEIPAESLVRADKQAVAGADVVGAISPNPAGAKKTPGTALFVDELNQLTGLAKDGKIPLDIQVAYPDFRWLGTDVRSVLADYVTSIHASLECDAKVQTPDATQIAEKIKAANKAKAVPGIVYRVPKPGKVIVNINGARAFDVDVSLYQFGYVGYKEISSKAFSKRTEKLAFSNGNLTQHERSATSAVAGASKFISTQVPSITSAISVIQTGNDTAKAAEIARVRDLALKRVDLDTVNQKLSANQTKIDAAATPADATSAQAERAVLLKEKIQIEADINALSQGLTLPKS